jgi:dihydroflavonol-4-reductase
MPETILLTGISGFIAKHVALLALNRGHAVRGTLRTMARADEVRDALRPHLTDPKAMDRLAFVIANLGDGAGWDQAVAGVTAVIHTASPFPMVQPKDEMALIAPAREGTLRVLRAAHKAGIGRVVLTSSVVAVVNGTSPGVQDESVWADPTAPHATAYGKSKTLAERAAWEFAGANGMSLTTINPGLVVGAPLDRHFGTSLDLVLRILKGRDPMLPDISFPVVDVRDVAEMHLRALERADTVGKRYLAVADGPVMSMVEIGRFFKSRYPTRRIATRQAPKFLLQMLSLVDPSLKTILPQIGQRHELSNQRARTEMGMRFVSSKDALAASSEWLAKEGLVWA